MKHLLERIKETAAGNGGPLALILAGGLLALGVGLGQLGSGQAAQGFHSLLVGSILLFLAWSARQQYS